MHACMHACTKHISLTALFLYKSQMAAIQMARAAAYLASAVQPPTSIVLDLSTFTESPTRCRLKSRILFIQLYKQPRSASRHSKVVARNIVNWPSVCMPCVFLRVQTFLKRLDLQGKRQARTIAPLKRPFFGTRADYSSSSK
jgi:hypothetical protein